MSKTLNDVLRANFEWHDDGISMCLNNHDKSLPCEFIQLHSSEVWDMLTELQRFAALVKSQQDAVLDRLHDPIRTR